MSRDPTAAGIRSRANDGWLMPVALIAALTLWRLAVAALLPMTKDEAYYIDWARHLAWGYFDHPPGVALLGLGTWLAPASAPAARLGAVVAGALTLVVLWRLYRRCGLGRRDDLLPALLLAAATPVGLISGVIPTPDTVLVLCWALALHEAAAALDGDRRRWLTAGLATGLGLLGKYTMIVVGPVFLWALLRTDPKALRTPWPYLGGLLALLVLLPNLVWNAQHDWLTLRFQLGHGFSADPGAIRLAADALPTAAGGMGHIDAEPPRGLGERLASLGGFVGSQLLFWGLVLVPIAAVLLHRGGLHRIRGDLTATLTPAGRSLLVAAALFPPALFAAIAWISEVEANWSAMYLLAAAPLVAIILRPLARWAVAAAGLNLILVLVYALHAASGALPLPDKAERIIRESYGYAGLAEHAATLPGPVFADRYQSAALLRFYRPDLDVGQWPGITRPSAYLTGELTPIPDLQALRRSGFTLVIRRYRPAQIPGFEVVSAQTVYPCGPRDVEVSAGEHGRNDARCPDAGRPWRIYRYRATDRSGG